MAGSVWNDCNQWLHRNQRPWKPRGAFQMFRLMRRKLGTNWGQFLRNGLHCNFSPGDQIFLKPTPKLSDQSYLHLLQGRFFIFRFSSKISPRSFVVFILLWGGIKANLPISYPKVIGKIGLVGGVDMIDLITLVLVSKRSDHLVRISNVNHFWESGLN